MTLYSVQYLRAVAALMVVVYHLQPQLERMGYAGYWPDWLASGVNIFFVISGIIMWITTAGQNVSPLEFYRRRIIRIVPLYWLLTSVAVLVLLVRPSMMQSTSFGLWHVVSSYLFIPARRPGTDELTPVLHPGWTLNYEMFFYLLFGAMLLLPARARLAAMGALFAGLIGLGIGAGGTAMADTILVEFYASGVLVEFLLGMWLGNLYLSGRLAAPRAVGWFLVVAGFTSLGLSGAAFPDVHHMIRASLPAGAILLGALILESSGGVARLPSLLRLGDASYSLYLSHSMLLSAMGQVWRRSAMAGLSGGLLLFCVIATGAALVWGLLIFRFVEMPLTRIFKRRASARSATQTDHAVGRISQTRS